MILLCLLAFIREMSKKIKLIRVKILTLKLLKKLSLYADSVKYAVQTRRNPYMALVGKVTAIVLRAAIIRAIA